MADKKDKYGMFPSAREEDEFKEDRYLDPESKIGSILAGAGQGSTLGYRDELNALLAAAARDRADASEFWDKYRKARDANRADDKAAHKANPKLFNTAEFATAMAAPLPIPKVAKGASLLEKGGKYALSALPVGSAFGLGASDSDLTRPSDFAPGSQDESNAARALADTAIGAGAAGLFAGAMPFAGAGVRAAAPKVAKGLQSGASGVSRWLKFMNAGNAPDEVAAELASNIAQDVPKMLDGPAQRAAAENLAARKTGMAQDQARIAAEKAAPRGIQLPVDPEVAKQAQLITKMKKLGVYEPEGVPPALKGKLDLEELPIEDAFQRKDLLDKLPALKDNFVSKQRYRERGPGYQESSPANMSPEPKVDPGTPSEFTPESFLTEPKYVPIKNPTPGAKGSWSGIEREMNALGRAKEQANRSKMEADPRFMLDNGPKLADISKKGTKWVQSLSPEEASAVQKADKLGIKALSPREAMHYLDAMQKNQKVFKSSGGEE